MQTKKWCALFFAIIVLFACIMPVYASGTDDTDETGESVASIQQTVKNVGNFLNEQNIKCVENIEMPNLDLTCRTAVLVCADTGDILYEKDADNQCSIASITKVMTLLLTMEAIESGKVTLSDIVPISAHAYGMGGSQIWLEPGEQFTLDELIKAICVSSANDAAVAVAEYIGGSETAFAENMNRRAAELGMENTHFVNACGLDAPGHYSSAHDVAIMSIELMKHKKIMEYTCIWQDTLRNGETQLTNTNKMLKTYQGITGLKTGTTGQAGVCISATATRDGLTLVAVVLGSASGDERFAAAASMLDYGFAAFEIVDFPPLSEKTDTVKVNNGAQTEVELVYNVPQKLLITKGSGKGLQATVSIEPQFEAPLYADQSLGSVCLKRDGTEIGKYSITSKCAVEKMNFNLAMQLLKKALFAA